MNKKVIVSAVVAALVMGSALYAEPEGSFGVNGPGAWNQPPEKRVKHTDSFGDTYYTYKYENPKEYVAKEVHNQKQNFKKAPKEIVEGLTKTLKAIEALQKNDTKSAQKYLDEASALFDKALKANPNLKLVPIANEIVVYEFAGTSQDVKKALDIAKGLIEKYETQVARAILIPMKDEIDIATEFIPMDLYPEATKKAAKLLKEGKKNEAIGALIDGLNTIVTNIAVVPIPLLSAQDLVEKASKLDKNKKDEVLKLLAAAKDELQKAVYLGYTKRHSKEYKSLSDEIAGIEKEVKGENKVEKLYEHIKNSFKSLIGKVRSENYSLKDSVSKEEEKALMNPSSVKKEAAAKAKVEEYQSKELFKAKQKVRIFEKETKEDEIKDKR